MPPGKPLPAEEIAAIRAWINAGAHWDNPSSNSTEPNWWAFKKVVRPAIPVVPNANNPIDAFILSKLSQQDGSGFLPAMYQGTGLRTEGSTDSQREAAGGDRFESAAQNAGPAPYLQLSVFATQGGRF
jgi:hypothetical protein